MAYEALDSLQQTLLQILKRDDDLTTHRVKQRIVSIHVQAVVLQSNLKDFPEKETVREVANTTQDIIQYLFSPENLSDCGSIEPTVTLSNQLGELAEELVSTAGDVVDYCKSNADSVNNARQLNDSPAVSSSSRSALTSKDVAVGFDEDLTESTELIVRISNRLGRLAERIKSTARDLLDNSRSNNSVNNSPAVGSSSRSSFTSKGAVVDFDDDRYQIMDRLTGRSSLLQVIPIVGMAGIGKSTLAKLVYENTSITQHFDVQAWVTISQDYSEKSIILDLLASMKRKKIQAETDVWWENAVEFHKYIKFRRYLIVMDDIWSTEAWDRVRVLFPDDGNGSRIILTTRLKDVATYADSSSTVHMMRFLDDQQSWNLFQHKVFAGQDPGIPLELEDVGRKIVKGCGGLPLSIVTVAGLFRIDRTPKNWEQIGANDGQLATILSLSYNHLSRHLKACLLYMAGFPEDYEIHASEVIKLWVAEGFLERQNESKSLEEEGEDCLEDLVDKSLVLVTSKKIDGKIKSCRLHSTMRDFCARQAGQDKFLLPVMDYLPSPILRRHFLPQVLQNHPGISLSWCDLDLKDSMHSSCTHSIICIPQGGYRPKGSVQNFSSLRVLHVLRRNDRSYWELGQVFDLIYLTYLATNIPSSIVPPAISKLQNLQTLIIYRSEVRLPVEIWSLRQLRHLIAFSLHPLPHPEREAFPLENLQSLSLVTDFVCSERMVKMIPNIRKLGICYSEEKFDGGYSLDNLIHLLQLEKLKLKLETRNSFWPLLNPVFPLSLKKLELSGWRLPWRDMTVFGSLPSLQVLKLKNYACDGEHWETIEGEFLNLRLLHIDESNLEHWTTESNHFPKLERLMLHRCPYLSEIPLDLGEIPTLQLIEIDDHNQFLLYSAKEIREEQRAIGNDDIQVRLKQF